MSKLSPSQCSRAVAINGNGNGHVAVSNNNGQVTIRESLEALDNIAFTLEDANEWNEVLKYSPDGSRLAVGSHDNKIYVYDAESYELQGELKGHSSYICSFDWSEDGTYGRSVCGAYDLLFWTMEDCE